MSNKLQQNIFFWSQLKIPLLTDIHCSVNLTIAAKDVQQYRTLQKKWPQKVPVKGFFKAKYVTQRAPLRNRLTMLQVAAMK